MLEMAHSLVLIADLGDHIPVVCTVYNHVSVSVIKDQVH